MHGRATLTAGRGGNHGQPVVVAIPGVSPDFQMLCFVLVLVCVLYLCYGHFGLS